MENLQCVIEDPLIKGYLKRFPRQEWNEVIKKTLRLGIHSMNTLQSLSLVNGSPEKNISIIDLDGEIEDESTVVLADSMNKLEGTTPSSKEGTKKIMRNDSKLPLKKKKTLSQVSKIKASRVTPKSKRSGFEFIKDKKESKRIQSVKGTKGKSENMRSNHFKEIQPNQDNLRIENIANIAKTDNEGTKEGNAKKICTKSFKSLNQKNTSKIHLSPKNQNNSPKGVKNLLGKKEINEFYINSLTNRNDLVDFPLKARNNLVLDPFVYITSSSEENSP